MTTRRMLPHRRASTTFSISWGGMRGAYVITCGYYRDGGLGEIFITGGKSGEPIEAIARDGAVLVSLALQYGAQLETLAGAITRDMAGAPQSVVGAVLDELIRGEHGRLQ